MVLSADEEATVLQEQAHFTERLDNEYAVKASQKREKRAERQTGRLQIYQILDTFAWDELPEAAQQMYSDLGWSQVCPPPRTSYSFCLQEQRLIFAFDVYVCVCTYVLMLVFIN